MIKIVTLGRFEIRPAEGGTPLLASQPKRAALLAYLAAAEPRGPQRRDKLLAAFWPELDQAKARHALSQALHAIRKELGIELFENRGDQEVGLDWTKVTCDVVEIREALAAGRSETALALYPGEFLSGFHLSAALDFERWAESARARLHEQVSEAAWSLAETQPDPVRAVRLARGAAAFSPYDEGVARRVIAFHLDRNDRVGALDCYQEFAALLGQEYQLEPSPETRALVEGIDRGAEPPGPMRSHPPIAEFAAASKKTTIWRRRRLAMAAVVVPWIVVVGALLLLAARDEAPGIEVVRTTQLTHDPGVELDPALSPDGRMVAYAAGPMGAQRIHLRQVAGGLTIVVSGGLDRGDHRRPQWTADGTRIVFQTEQAVYAVPALGGTARRVVETSGRSNPSPTLSPDGSEIAYVDNDVIYIGALTGGKPREVATAFRPHSMSWSPDGTRLAYVSGNYNFIFGSVASLGNISPSSIWIVAVGGGEPVAITTSVSLNMSPVWTPDSRFLLFVSGMRGGRDIYRVAVEPSGAPRGEAERLTTGLDAHSISLSADGLRLAYSVYTYESNIWAIEIPARPPISISAAQQVSFGSQAIEGIGVSPDGTWLVYDANLSGNQDIYRRHLPDGDPEQLTTHPADDFVPSWSPDGQEIAFYSVRTGNRDVFVMADDGSSLQQVTDDPAQDLFPDWSPDGNSLVFQSDKTGQVELHVVSRHQRGSPWGETRQLTTDGGGVARWSPDGKHIAYVRAGSGGFVALQEEPDLSVRVIDAEGGEPRILVQGGDGTPLPGFPEWSSDGRTIYYKAVHPDGTDSFWSVPVGGGAPTLLVRFDDPSRRSYRNEFTTDGRRLYFTMGRHHSDIWVAELESGG